MLKDSSQITTTITVSEFTRSLKRVEALVQDGPAILTYRRKPVAVILSMEDYRTFLELKEVLKAE